MAVQTLWASSNREALSSRLPLRHVGLLEGTVLVDDSIQKGKRLVVLFVVSQRKGCVKTAP